MGCLPALPALNSLPPPKLTCTLWALSPFSLKYLLRLTRHDSTWIDCFYITVEYSLNVSGPCHSNAAERPVTHFVCDMNATTKVDVDRCSVCGFSSDLGTTALFQKWRFWFSGTRHSHDSSSDTTDQPIGGMQSDDVTLWNPKQVVF